MTQLGRVCTAAGIPAFSPHDLRHRRISLLHLRGVPWARIGEHVGQRSLAVTADTYTHVLADEIELDYGALLAERTTTEADNIAILGAWRALKWLTSSKIRLRRSCSSDRNSSTLSEGLRKNVQP